MEAARVLNKLASPTDGPAELTVLPAPHRPEREFYDNDNFVLAHGVVEVPRADKPVNYTVTVPETLDSPLPHLIIPGFGGIKRSSRGLRNAMAGQENRLTISFDPARGGGFLHDLLDAQRVHGDTVSAILQDLPDNEELRDTHAGDQIDFSQAVLLPHSMGGLPATEYARRHPEDTEAVIYMGSVGLETNVLLNYVGRVAKSISNDVTGKYVKGKLVPGANRLDLAFKTGRYYLSNPRRTLGEIGSCMTADIHEPVQALGKLGVRTGALYFDTDKLVPAREDIVESTRQLVDICDVMEGYGHLAPQRSPSEVAARLGHISAQLEQLGSL